MPSLKPANMAPPPAGDQWNDESCRIIRHAVAFFFFSCWISLKLDRAKLKVCCLEGGFEGVEGSRVLFLWRCVLLRLLLAGVFL